MGSFTSYRKATLPVMFRGPNGQSWAEALGGAQDEEMDRLRVAGRLRSPARAPDDALDDIGSGLGIARNDGESDEAYRARLMIAWATWEIAGSPVSIEDQIRAFGIPDALVLVEAGDGPIYEGSWYSRARAFLGPDFGSTGIGPSLLGVSTTLGGFLLGSTATVAQRSALKHIIWKWKAAHGVVPDIYLVYETAAQLGVTSTLGVGFVLGSYFGQSCTLTILPEFGFQTYLGSWVLGGVDLT